MPGPALHIEVLRLAIETLDAGSPGERDRARILRDNLPFAQLGALGPDILRFRPVPQAAIDTLANTADLTMLTQAEKDALAKQVFPNPEMALFGAAYRILLPILVTVQAFDDTLTELADIVAAEDVDRLKGIRPKFETLQAEFIALGDFKEQGRRIYAAGVIAAVAGRPPIQAPMRAAPAGLWRPHEYLRWKRTGAFAQALLAEAEGQDDDQLRAYAMGWLTHVAGAVTAEPFVNAIVAGPSRSHWWRNRYVRHYVDAWTFGRYRTPAAMTGDEPVPPYQDWAPVGTANLQDAVRVDAAPLGPDAAAVVGGGAMPATPGFDKVAALLATATAKAYSGEPAINQPPAGLTDPVALREAYVGALSVLWFMTGHATLFPKHPGPAPAGAEIPPDWYNDGTAPPPSPGTPGGGGGGGAGAATVSGIIAAILAAIAIVFGNVIVGAAALVAGIAALINAADAGDPFDWNGVRTDVHWIRVRLFDGKIKLHAALLRGTVAYPLGGELGMLTGGSGPNPGTWSPALDTSGVALTRSRETRAYPRRMFDTVQDGTPLPADGGFDQDPQSPVEEAGTRAQIDPGGYPERVIDGAGLLNGGLLGDDGSVPSRDVTFGDAVSNAVDLIRTDAAGLVDYNLDGDRGYGWKTWRPRLNSTLADPNLPVSVVEE